MENKTPIRKKAVATRQKLLEATFEQIALHGYHNITVDKIANAADVSTGTAYRYFKNKKEMLIAAIEYYYGNIQEFSNTPDNTLAAFDNLEDMLSYTLEQFYRIHKKYYEIHEELESLRHIDPEIKAVYNKITQQAVNGLMKKCPDSIAALPNLKERLYACIGILENFAHTQMEEEVPCTLNLEELKNLSLHAVISILKTPSNI